MPVNAADYRGDRHYQTPFHRHRYRRRSAQPGQNRLGPGVCIHATVDCAHGHLGAGDRGARGSHHAGRLATAARLPLLRSGGTIFARPAGHPHAPGRRGRSLLPGYPASTPHQTPCMAGNRHARHRWLGPAALGIHRGHSPAADRPPPRAGHPGRHPAIDTEQRHDPQFLDYVANHRARFERVLRGTVPGDE